MNCPHCGFSLEAASAQLCPRCGQAVFNVPDNASSSAQVSKDPGASESLSIQPRGSASTTSQWMKPSLPPAPVMPRPNRRRRRNLVALIIAIFIVGACGGYGYVVFFAHGSTRASSTTIPGSNSLFSDPLTSPSTGWSNDSSHCFFQDNAYHIKDNVVFRRISQGN